MTDYPVCENVLKVPYSWTTGEVIGDFLTAFRDGKQILGAKCPACRRIQVPPTDMCVPCNEELHSKDLTPVSDEGTVVGFTKVDYKLLWRPAEPPYAIVMVRLFGTDTDFIHLVKTKVTLDKLKIGARVKAKWKNERKGHITDLDEFEVTWVPEESGK